MADAHRPQPAAPPLAHRLALALSHWPASALADALAQVSRADGRLAADPSRGANDAGGGWQVRLWDPERVELCHDQGVWLSFNAAAPGGEGLGDGPGRAGGHRSPPNEGDAEIEHRWERPDPSSASPLDLSRWPPWVRDLPVVWRCSGPAVQERRALPAGSFETAMQLLRRPPEESVRAALASCPQLALALAGDAWVGLHVSAPPPRVVAWVERAAPDGALRELRARAGLALGVRATTALTVSGTSGSCVPTWRVA